MQFRLSTQLENGGWCMQPVDGVGFQANIEVGNNEKKAGWVTQYTQDGTGTMGRTYERESVSSYTTKAVVDYLMTIHDPSDEVQNAINNAVEWLSFVKIAGKEQEVVTDTSMNNRFDVYFVDGSGTWSSNYVYESDSDTYRPLYSDVDSYRPDQPYVNVYEVNELHMTGSKVDSSDLNLYVTRTMILDSKEGPVL